MYGIDHKVAALKVRRSLGDARPTLNHVFVVASVALTNRGDSTVTAQAAPAVFVAVDGSEYPPADPALWSRETTVGPRATEITHVVFEVPRTKSVSGTVRFVRQSGPEDRRLHLAS